MPPKTLIAELGSREFICKSCLSCLHARQNPPPTLWHARRSSGLATAAHPPRSRDPQTSDAERLRTLKALGLLRDDLKKEAKIKINFFEEANSGKLRRLDGRDAFAGSLSDPGGDFARQLQELEATLTKATELGKALEKMAQGEDGDGAHNSAADLQLMEDYERERADAPSRSIYIDPESYPPRFRHDLMRVNIGLQKCAKRLDQGRLGPKERKQLWRFYETSRRVLAGNWKGVPPSVWEVLWDVFCSTTLDDSNRMAHIYRLTRDMKAAGIELSPERQLLALEAMFIEGWQKEAVENHRRWATTLGTNPNTLVDYWALGLRMHCLAGDVERAERMAEIILESPHQADPRILIPLIRTYAEHPSGNINKAYGTYQRLRALLGQAMVLEDYDKVISFFLASGHTEHALWVFVDMMTLGSIQLRGMKELPLAVANPLFIGKWLKKLIGDGNYDGAHNVLLHVRSRGVVPRPIQVNGLVGAWLRSGTAENFKKADALAWAMINSRLQFVQLRRSGSRAFASQPSGPGWPAATLETFSLLADNYHTRGLGEQMIVLWDAFQQAEIAPDSFFLNKLLFSYLNAGQGVQVAALWRSLSTRYQIKPDPWTFSALWQALGVNRLHKLPGDKVAAEVADSRRLFADLVANARRLSDDVDLPLARTIMHTFRRLGDKAGLLVAYRALRELFHLSDPGPLVFEMMLGTPDVQSATRTPRSRQRLVLAGQRVEHFLSHRQKELAEAKQLGQGEDMPPEMKANEMGHFLDLHLEDAVSKLPNGDADFRQAARDMGLIVPESE